jgi:hypothetical protein
MKKLAIISACMLMLGGCASRQLKCRFVAIDMHGRIMPKQTKQMHSHWHKGMGNCTTMIYALAEGYVTETITGDQAGVEIRGPKKKRLELQKMIKNEQGSQQQAQHFPVMTTLAE